jgi:hypothetical protein
LRVTRSAGAAACTVFARKHRFSVGGALSFDEQHPAVTALEYALGALAADVIEGYAAAARRARVDVDNLEAVVQGDVENALAHLGVVGIDGRPRLSQLTLKVYASSTDDDEVLQKLWADVLAKSVLVTTFSGVVKLELSLKTT